MLWKFLLFTAATGTAGLMAASAAQAAPDSFIGQIVAVGEDFCPQQFMPAHGQVLPVNSNPALFSVIGCSFGGDCRSTFALPDLRGRAASHRGQGPGLPTVNLGESYGTPSASLTVNDIPAHNHRLVGAADGGGQFNSPAGNALPTYTDPDIDVYADDPPEPSVQLNAGTIANTGMGAPFDLHQPTIAVNFCIAVEGIYPSRG